MEPDLWELYRQMLRSRRFEEAVADLWRQGLISGEMHLGLGEEAIYAAVEAHLQEGDALALDHRGSGPLLLRGVAPTALLGEMLGHSGGLCRGQGGHMHLFSPLHLAASSGIVGAAGPLACGFALAAEHLRPGKLAVAYCGEGALNQGQMLESLNLAAAWRLPLLFVCKDNGWAITTRSEQVTGGDLLTRARGFGLTAEAVDGWEAGEVWRAAGGLVARVRSGKGPAFLLARCVHLEGHFLGDQLLSLARRPLAQAREMLAPLWRAATQGQGAPWPERAVALGRISAALGSTAAANYLQQRDPLPLTRRRLKSVSVRLEKLEKEVDQEMAGAVDVALGSSGGAP